MLNIEYAALTEKGGKSVNEDAVRVCESDDGEVYGFALADGLGGHGHGDVASSIVGDCFAAVLENIPRIGPDFLDEAFTTLQNVLTAEMKKRDLPAIRTTLVLLVIADGVAQWGHIGDSRLYLIRRGRLFSRTRDHSVPQMLVDAGRIREKDIRRHPARNQLLRAMGAEWDGPAYEIGQRAFPVEDGDVFLLCSDGFWDWLTEKKMRAFLRRGRPLEETLSRMERQVLKNGAGSVMDNYSAVLVRIAEKRSEGL